MQKNTFWDSVYFKNIIRVTDGLGFLTFDTLVGSPTFGKLTWVRPRVLQDFSRVAVALTTTGTSGVATYSNTTGIFNVPNYGGRVKSKGVTLEAPTSSENFGLWQTQVDITVSSINAVVIGSSPSVTINIAFGTNITSLTNVFSSGTAITNTTTGQTINSGFNDATIPAGSWIRLTSSAASGTITQIEVTINYTED